MNKIIIASLGLLFSGIASATLPPLSADAQANANEAKHKSAWSKKISSYKLCLTQNRIAERYLQKNNKPKQTSDVPPCQNPGPYVPQQAQLSSATLGERSKN